MKLYTATELKRKYKGKFINVCPHPFEYRNPKTHQFETVYEVRGVSKEVRENYETPEEVLEDRTKC